MDKHKIDRKFVERFYQSDRPTYIINAPKMFKIFFEKKLLKPEDFRIIKRTYIIEHLLSFQLGFTSEHIIELAKKYHQNAIKLYNLMKILIETGIVLDQKVIDYCENDGVFEYTLYKLHQNRIIRLSNENLTKIFLNSDKDGHWDSRELVSEIIVNQDNIEKLFKLAEFKYLRKKIGDVKINIKCLENACLLSANFSTIKTLIEKYKLQPNNKCLENACTLKNNPKVVKYLIGFNLEITKTCLVNILALIRLNQTARIVLGAINPIESDDNIGEVEGVEKIEI